MSSETPTAADWWEQVAAMNETYADMVEQTMTAQSRVVDAWLDSVDELTRQDRLDEGAEATVRAYEIWMQAARDSLEELNDVLEGEDVPPDQFRDTWLTAANRAFKEVMQTSAFAYATGQSVDDVLDARRQFEDLGETTLHTLQLPTAGDIEEVGERLVELERRQHAVEQRLDTLIESLEE